MSLIRRRLDGAGSSSGRSWFVVVSEPGSFVRRRQGAGVGADTNWLQASRAFWAAEEARADGRKASQRPKGKSLYFLSLFIWGVCVCVRPRL